MAAVRAKRKPLEFDYEEGYIVITPDSENVSMLPDDSGAAAFLRRSPRAFDSLQALPNNVRIRALVVAGDCRQ